MLYSGQGRGDGRAGWVCAVGLGAEQGSHAVKAAAAALGFDACGMAEAGPVDPEDRLGAWLARGFHADMDWLVRTKDLRQDVRRKLPGARSVVVVARNYYAERPAAPEGTGRVSRYAWGRDYHRVLGKPLRRLADRISQMGDGVRCYCCVDTGPVMEREWAVRAGVGWPGKNGLVLREDLGSWFFLGVIVTTLELAPDPPVASRCGTCQRCVEACPTGAIVEPGVVDARRCISYLTIENRGPIPEEIEPRLGDWVFGCDVCQEVCPWNRKARETSEQDFHPREGQAFVDPDALARMDRAAFEERFAGTAIRRATYDGMQRNARVVRRFRGDER